LSSRHISAPSRYVRKEREAWELRNMARRRVEEARCASGENCAAYPALGEPSKLSRSNPGTRCFACEEQRRVASNSEVTAAEKKIVGRGKAEDPRQDKANGLKEYVGRKHTEVERAREVWERRKTSVLTCERGLRSALASSDERLVRRWSRSLREAEARLVWADADLARAEKRSEYTE
jgi:hypothetical protein